MFDYFHFFCLDRVFTNTVLTTKNGVFTEEHLHKIMTGAVVAVKDWLKALHQAKSQLSKANNLARKLQHKVDFQAAKIAHLEK